jgi:hypothetical protein
VAQGEQREFCLEVWWSAFLLDLLARKVVRVVPGDVCPLVLVDYEALGVCTRR